MPARARAVVRLVADLVAITGSFAVSVYVYDRLIASGAFPMRSPPDALAYVRLTSVYAASWMLTAGAIGLYSPRASVLNLWELSTALKASMASGTVVLAWLFALKVNDVSRLVVILSLLLSTIVVLTVRRALASYLSARAGRGEGAERVLIVGADDTGRLLMKKILTAPHLGHSVVGFLDPVAAPGTEVSIVTDQATRGWASRQVLGHPDDLDEVAARVHIDQVLINEGSVSGPDLLRLYRKVESLGLNVGIVPSLLSLRPDNLIVEDLGAIPVLRPSRPRSLVTYSARRRVIDVVAALIGLLLLSPLLVIAAVAIRLDTTGPVLFTHNRVGLRGKTFLVYKFRTMRTDADPYAASPEGDSAPYITRVGRVLRATGLDELPQLINVLRGDMCLVGPRPEMPQIVAEYSALERRRLDVPPGITGLWQISPDRHSQIHDNIEYDLFYRSHRSTLLDIACLIETAFFTAELVLRKLFRSKAAAPPVKEVSAVVQASRRRYVLLAMDQRDMGTRSPRWDQALRLSIDGATGQPIRIPVSPSNRDALDATVRAVSSNRERIPSIEYVRYPESGELAGVVGRAAIVVTDLPVVAKAALDGGVQLISL